MSITPTQRPASPTPTTTLEFQTVNACNMSFVIPSYLKFKPAVEAGADSYVDADGNALIVFGCYDPAGQPDSAKKLGFPNKVKDFLETVNTNKITATVSGNFTNNVQNKVYEGKDIRYVRLIHPKIGDFVSVDIHSSIYPLFEKTLEFVTPTPTKKPSVTSIISP